MKPLTQVCKRIKSIGLYIICYLLCSVIIISFFSFSFLAATFPFSIHYPFSLTVYPSGVVVDL